MSARIVVLISGAGSNMAALVDAAADPGYGAEIVAVGADRPGAKGLATAHAAGIPTFVTPFTDYSDRAHWNAALSEHIAEYRPDLVVSAGFMRILGSEVIGRHTVINIHPALLPAFPGAHAVRDAIAHGVKLSGATVHFVDEGVDTGPIIDQVTVRVEPGDTAEILHERIKTVERRMLVDVVGRLARDGWSIDGRRVDFTPPAAGSASAGSVNSADSASASPADAAASAPSRPRNVTAAASDTTATEENR